MISQSVPETEPSFPAAHLLSWAPVPAATLHELARRSPDCAMAVASNPNTGPATLAWISQQGLGTVAVGSGPELTPEAAITLLHHAPHSPAPGYVAAVIAATSGDGNGDVRDAAATYGDDRAVADALTGNPTLAGTDEDGDRAAAAVPRIAALHPQFTARMLHHEDPDVALQWWAAANETVLLDPFLVAAARDFAGDAGARSCTPEPLTGHPDLADCDSAALRTIRRVTWATLSPGALPSGRPVGYPWAAAQLVDRPECVNYRSVLADVADEEPATRHHWQRGRWAGDETDVAGSSTATVLRVWKHRALVHARAAAVVIGHEAGDDPVAWELAVRYAARCDGTVADLADVVAAVR